MSKKTFLFEIGCEELPASAQVKLSKALHDQMTTMLEQAKLSFENIKTFAAPRRLALLVNGLDERQPPQTVEKLGPNIEAAFDKAGSPTLACLGFAKSCGVTLDDLTEVDTPKGKRLAYLSEKAGELTADLLPSIMTEVIAKLPLSKPMRWGNHEVAFIRPVHWVLALFGTDVIPMTLFGLQSCRKTFGHRFHHPKPLVLNRADDYSMVLYTQGFVIADFDVRKKAIEKGMQALIGSGQRLVENEALLDEVTALVEWPVVLKGNFNRDFLSVPKEVLITSMETHQKCFAMVDTNGKLLPHFILVSNIESKNPEAVIHGNERVIHARLSDAKFFYDQDKKTPLKDRLPVLDAIIFEKQLGSIGDKVKRIQKLSGSLAKTINADLTVTKEAATLCKADLVTDMVYEFPNLQGVMGYYYALNDGLSEGTALAIKEQYLPRFSGDVLPESLAGCAIAIADRLDTIIGILGIKKKPTGDKDPFGLRRAALGVLRIIIEKSLPIDLMDALKAAKKGFACKLPNEHVIDEAFNYIMTRLKALYAEKDVPVEVFEAVMACNPTSPIDFDRRIQAVMQFQTLPEAQSLAAANKRVSNILKKQAKNLKLSAINDKLFEEKAEHALAKHLASRKKIVDDFYKKANYEKALTELSTLKSPIDQFFDDVMIMSKDEKVKRNRLAMLAHIRELFTKVADISLLP